MLASRVVLVAVVCAAAPCKEKSVIGRRGTEAAPIMGERGRSLPGRDLRPRRRLTARSDKGLLEDAPEVHAERVGQSRARQDETVCEN